ADLFDEPEQCVQASKAADRLDRLSHCLHLRDGDGGASLCRVLGGGGCRRRLTFYDRLRRSCLSAATDLRHLALDIGGVGRSQLNAFLAKRLDNLRRLGTTMGLEVLT